MGPAELLKFMTFVQLSFSIKSFDFLCFTRSSESGKPLFDCAITKV